MSADWVNMCGNLQEKLHKDPQFSTGLFLFPKLLLAKKGRGSDDITIQE
jgi:hypothetical protein